LPCNALCVDIDSNTEAVMTTLGQFDPKLTQLIVDDEASRLHRDCHATAVLLLNRAGQIIVWRGAAFSEERVQLGALVAGVFASTREVAKILREQAFKRVGGRTCSRSRSAANGCCRSSSVSGAPWSREVAFRPRRD